MSKNDFYQGVRYRIYGTEILITILECDYEHNRIAFLRDTPFDAFVIGHYPEVINEETICWENGIYCNSLKELYENWR